MLKRPLLLSLSAVVVALLPACVRGQVNPYDAKTISADPTTHRLIPVYSQDNAPSAPKLEDLPLRESVSQYGITWTFEKPARVGQFVNGDWYVVGPVTIKAIDPQPLYGSEIPTDQLDHMDKERPGSPAGPQRLHAQSAGRR